MPSAPSSACGGRLGNGTRPGCHWWLVHQCSSGSAREPAHLRRVAHRFSGGGAESLSSWDAGARKTIQRARSRPVLMDWDGAWPIEW